MKEELKERLDEFTGMLSDYAFTDICLEGSYRSVFGQDEKYETKDATWRLDSLSRGLEQGDFDKDALFLLLPRELML